MLQAESTESAKALRQDRTWWVYKAAGRPVRLEQGSEGAVGPVGAKQPAELASQGQEVGCSLQGTARVESLKPFPMGGAQGSRCPRVQKAQDRFFRECPRSPPWDQLG